MRQLNTVCRRCTVANAGEKKMAMKTVHQNAAMLHLTLFHPSPQRIF